YASSLLSARATMLAASAVDTHGFAPRHWRGEHAGCPLHEIRARGRGAARLERPQERGRGDAVALAPRPPSAIEDGAAGGAEVAPVMDHARPDAINVGHVLLTQPHRIRFAGRALLRAPLLRGRGRRREGEREADQRGGSHDRPELRLCSVHY